MEPLQTLSESPALDSSSTVDTSRPFSSVKEAVAIFGERFLVGEIYSPKPVIDTSTATPPPPKREPSWRFSSPGPMKSTEDNARTLSDTLKKLEAELEETGVELKLLKERESETEVALATLNAELHENKSKLAAAVARKTVRFEGEMRGCDDGGIRNEEKKRELMKKMDQDSQTLAQIISIGEKDSYFGRKKERKMMKKKKPIIPLVGDLFSRKKGYGANIDHHHNPLYASPFFYN